MVFGLEPNLDTFNAMMHVLGNPKKVRDASNQVVGGVVRREVMMRVGKSVTKAHCR